VGRDEDRSLPEDSWDSWLCALKRRLSENRSGLPRIGINEIDGQRIRSQDKQSLQLSNLFFIRESTPRPS
jgi:hypothetical protein